MSWHGTHNGYTNRGCRCSDCRAANTAYHRARRERGGWRPATCLPCCHGACDKHQIPPVCVCDSPNPDVIGECTTCKRPYKPSVPGFDTCREAWRTRLAEVAA